MEYNSDEELWRELSQINGEPKLSELEVLQKEHDEKLSKIEELKRQIESTKHRLEKKQGTRDKMGSFVVLSKKYNSIREEYNAILAGKSSGSNDIPKQVEGGQVQNQGQCSQAKGQQGQLSQSGPLNEQLSQEGNFLGLRRPIVYLEGFGARPPPIRGPAQVQPPIRAQNMMATQGHLRSTPPSRPPPLRVLLPKPNPGMRPQNP